MNWNDWYAKLEADLFTACNRMNVLFSNHFCCWFFSIEFLKPNEINFSKWSEYGWNSTDRLQQKYQLNNRSYVSCFQTLDLTNIFTVKSFGASPVREESTTKNVFFLTVIFTSSRSVLHDFKYKNYLCVSAEVAVVPFASVFC
jgi:hypothetical protein